MEILQIIFIMVICYLIGSLPIAFFVCLLVSKINIFEVGSGNMGGTNVARTIGLQWGILTAILDIVKGIIAVLGARYMMNGAPSDLSLIGQMAGGLAAVAGHNWSIFATFLFWYYNRKFEIHGGKGASTAMGSMIVLLPIEASIMTAVIGVGLAFLTRYASLGVLTSFTISLAYTIGWAILSMQQTPQNVYYIPFALGIWLLIVWRFRENIQRLMAGNERKIGERVAESPSS